MLGDERLYMKGIKLASIQKKGLEKVAEIYRENINTTLTILKYCKNSGIRFYRIGDLFPFNTHPILAHYNYFDDFDQELYELGQYIKIHDIRISVHSSPYCILSSDNPEIVKKSILELTRHAALLRKLEVPSNNRIVVHVGSSVGGKEKSSKRFVDVCNNLPTNVKNAIALENDDKQYSISDVLDISNKCSIPVILDIFHHSLHNPEKIDIIRAMELATATWKDGPAEIHYSCQEEGKIKGSHSDTVNAQDLLTFVTSVNNLSYDIMLEVKDTHQSVEKFLRILQK